MKFIEYFESNQFERDINAISAIELIKGIVFPIVIIIAVFIIVSKLSEIIRLLNEINQSQANLESRIDDIDFKVNLIQQKK